MQTIKNIYWISYFWLCQFRALTIPLVKFKCKINNSGMNIKNSQCVVLCVILFSIKLFHNEFNWNHVNVFFIISYFIHFMFMLCMSGILVKLNGVFCMQPNVGVKFQLEMHWADYDWTKQIDERVKDWIMGNYKETGPHCVCVCVCARRSWT